MQKNKKTKNGLFVSLLVLDFVLICFLFVVSIIMLVKTNRMTQAEILSEYNVGFIAYLQKNPAFYLWVFVVPLFVLLAANIVGLVIYTKKSAKAEPIHVNTLSEEQKKALLEEMLKEQENKKK